MAVSELYQARAVAAVAVTTQTPLLGIYGGNGTQTKRGWVTGMRLSAALPAAGNTLTALVQVGRSSGSSTASSVTAGTPIDPASPTSIGSYATAWSVAPTFSGTLVVWELEALIAQTTASAYSANSSWVEFPPLGYEWGYTAGSSASTSGLFVWITQTVATSVTWACDLIWSE